MGDQRREQLVNWNHLMINSTITYDQPEREWEGLSELEDYPMSAVEVACYLNTRSGKILRSGDGTNSLSNNQESTMTTGNKIGDTRLNIGGEEYNPDENRDEHVIPQPKQKTMLLSDESGNALPLQAQRKLGYQWVTIMKSLKPGAGEGIFAYKTIPAGRIITSYEGPQLSDTVIQDLESGRWENDYVAEVINDHVDRTVIYVDGQGKTSFGSYANDPINDHLVNAKLVWTKTGVVLRSTKTIFPGEEIYIDYGIKFWFKRLHLLSEEDSLTISNRVKQLEAKAIRKQKLNNSKSSTKIFGGGVERGSASSADLENESNSIPSKKQMTEKDLNKLTEANTKINQGNELNKVAYKTKILAKMAKEKGKNTRIFSKNEINPKPKSPTRIRWDTTALLYPHPYRQSGEIKANFAHLYDQWRKDFTNTRKKKNLNNHKFPFTESTKSHKLITHQMIEVVPLDGNYKWTTAASKES